MKKITSLPLYLAWLLLPAGLARAVPEAIEVGPQTARQLPGGKEADGIRGDFILRNNFIEAVISGNQPDRKANMSTYYGAPTPGCLYDLTLRGEGNDQLTIFAPCGQQGPISYVRVAKSGSTGEAVVEAVSTSANHDGLYVRHEYHLKEDWQGLWIVTTVRNESKEVKKMASTDRWTTFNSTGIIHGITWADAVDPADKIGYAYAWLEGNGMELPLPTLELKPGQETTFGRFVAVGHSPAEAFGVVDAQKEKTGLITGVVKDAKGDPIPTARLDVALDKKSLPAYPDAQGGFSFRWPIGDYQVTIGDLGRPIVRQAISVNGRETSALNITMEPASAVQFDIRNSAGLSIPCKVQFIGIDSTRIAGAWSPQSRSRLPGPIPFGNRPFPGPGSARQLSRRGHPRHRVQPHRGGGFRRSG